MFNQFISDRRFTCSEGRFFPKWRLLSCLRLTPLKYHTITYVNFETRQFTNTTAEFKRDLAINKWLNIIYAEKDSQDNRFSSARKFKYSFDELLLYQSVIKLINMQQYFLCFIVFYLKVRQAHCFGRARNFMIVSFPRASK